MARATDGRGTSRRGSARIPPDGHAVRRGLVDACGAGVRPCAACGAGRVMAKVDPEAVDGRAVSGHPAGRLALLIVPALALLALAGPAAAQSVTLDLGADASGGLAGRTIQILALVTVLSVVPGLAIMVTCFPFLVTVLSILRQAIGLQQAPPNMLIVSLALILTWFVMDPVLRQAWADGIAPLSDGRLTPLQAWEPTVAPFRVFMAARVSPSTFAAMAELAPGGPLDPAMAPGVAPLSVLVPSFLLSEIARAFQVGFLIFLPFLVIDLVVAAVLMAMGMMMVPPAMVALPFKLAFFVVADGWTLVAESLVRGYG